VSKEFKDIIYTKNEHIARITINRPHVLNAFTNHTLLEMIDALEDASKDDAIGVVVLSGVGDRAFSAGGDVKWEMEGGLAEMRNREPADIHSALRRCRKPVIAAVKGYAIGGGHHIAYFCDLTIAADNAIFGQNGPRVGSPAEGLTVAYLTRIVGAKKAREIWYLCRRYSAEEALRIGLVNVVVPLAQLDAEVDRWCQEILDKSPTCIRILKASFDQEFDYMRGYRFGHFQQWLAPDYYDTDEPLEGQRAFIEKRQPDFRRFLTRPAQRVKADTGGAS
jgi:dihydroxynaphthoic acid synthetase